MEETKSRRAIDGKDTRENIDFDDQKIGKSVEAPSAPLAEPVKHDEAPILSMRDLMSEGLRDEAAGDESFKLVRVDFMILYRKVKAHMEEMMDLDDPAHDWEIPNQTTFENCQSLARTRKRKRTHSQLHVHACRPELASTET